LEVGTDLGLYVRIGLEVGCHHTSSQYEVGGGRVVMISSVKEVVCTVTHSLKEVRWRWDVTHPPKEPKWDVTHSLEEVNWRRDATHSLKEVSWRWV
jgi:hypothetical protein